MKLHRLLVVLLFFVLLNTGCGESKDVRIKRRINSLSAKARNASHDTRDHNMQLLAAEGEYAVPYLLDGLENKDEFIRKYCAMALAKIGSEDAIEPIRNMLFQDTSDENRAAAAGCLATLKKEAAIPDLIKALKQDTSVNAHQVIRAVLTRKGIASVAREQLLPYLKGPDINMRIEARETIVNMGADSVPALTGLLSTTDDQTLILEVFKALVKIGDTSVLHVMKNTMQRFPAWDDNEERKKKNKFYKELEGLYNNLYLLQK